MMAANPWDLIFTDDFESAYKTLWTNPLLNYIYRSFSI